MDAFDRGEQAPVPLLTGFNSGEIRSLMVIAPKPAANAAEYERIIRERYRDLSDEFLKLYPSARMEESILATTRDALYGWTAERLVRKQDAPHPSDHLLRGMYEFNEAVVSRRREIGDVAWGWNVGIASPTLPDQKTPAN